MSLPIADRELRVLARSPRTYRGRLVTAFVFALITGWLLWFMSKTGRANAVSAQAYAFITQISLMMCFFSINVTADSISSEKRGGTLGLLFLTDLKGVDIVVGKLAANGLVAFYSLLGILPVISVPVLMGGVSGESLFRTACTLLNSLFFALCLGLWVSARSWDQKKAMNAGVGIAMLILWGFPALAGALEVKGRWLGLAAVLKLLSPYYQQNFSTPFGMGMRLDRYWESLAITHALAWLALWAACRRTPREWQDRPVGFFRWGWRGVLDNFRFGSPSSRVAFRSRLLQMNAIHWLSAREKSAPLWTWLFILFTILGWIGFWAYIRSSGGNNVPFWGIGVPAVLIMALGLRMRACTLSAEVIGRDRFSGALELLLSTTLTTHDVARGIWMTFRRTILGPAIATFFIGSVVILFVFTESKPGLLYGAVAYIGLTTLFVSDLIASVWASMWMACVARTAIAGPGLAIIRLLAIPWVIFLGIVTIVAVLGSYLFSGGLPVPFELVCVTWFGILFSSNLFWIFRSRRLFHARLRLAASERYQPPATKKAWWRLDWLNPFRSREIRLSPGP